MPTSSILDRNTAWLFLTMTVALLIGLQAAVSNDFGRLILLAFASLLIASIGARTTKIRNSRLRLLIQFCLAELAILLLWSGLNIIRVFTYDAFIEGPSLARTMFSFAVTTQDILVWCVPAVLCLFLLYVVTHLKALTPRKSI